MKLGISSWTYTWAVGVAGRAPRRPLGPGDLVERAVALGVGVVQVADNLPLHVLTEVQLLALHERALAAGVEIEVGTRGLAPPNMRRYLDIARLLEARLLRVIVDSPGDEPAPDEIVSRLRTLLPALEAAGLTLGIENHDRLRARELADIVARIDSPRVGVCLDTVNSFGALEGPEVVVKALAPHTVNLHLKDFAMTRAPNMMGFVIEGRPVGQGRLELPWLLAALRAHGRDVNAIIELWTPDQGDLVANIEMEANWARQSVAAARHYIAD